MGPVFELEDVVVDVATADAAVDLNLQVVSQRQTDFLGLLCQLTGRRQNQDLWLSQRNVNRLQRPQREDARLTSAALALHNNIAVLDDRQNCPLLDS